MKRLIFMFSFLLLITTSCTQNTQMSLNIKNMEKKDKDYYLEICDSINLIDYIESNGLYSVEYKGKIYKSTEQLIFELDDFNNEFLVKFNSNTIKLFFYKPVNYNITFKDESGSYVYTTNIDSRQSIDIDLVKDNILVPSGYTWRGIVKVDNTIMSIDSIKFNKDTELTLVYEKMSFACKLIILNQETTINLTIGEMIDIDFKEIEGYDFLGLYAGERKIEIGAIYDFSMGTLFELKYSPKDFTITYHYNDKTEKQVVKYGKDIPLLELNLIGYSFDGWMYNNNMFSDKTFNFTQNIDLYAKLTPNKYTLTYTNIDNEYSIEVYYDEKFILPIPTKEGAIFVGWYYNGTKIENGIWKYLENISITAKWLSNSVILNLEANGGSVDNKCLVNSDGLINLPIPTLKDYRFINWYYDENFTIVVNELYVFDYNNEKLYALYEYNEENIIASFTITRYNAHTSAYDDLAIFDASQSGFASLYWHKIGVKKINNEYYISGIVKNGDKLSNMTYDYVILAYSNYANYNEFANSNVKVGDKVLFNQDIESLDDNDINIMVSFISIDYTENLDAIKEELENIYGEYQDLAENIELVSMVSGVNITWKSSNNEIISSTGIYHKPFTNVNVTLSAYVNETLIYSFTIVAKGDNDHYDALATGYIYTPYTITQNAMNTLDIIYCAFLDIDANAEFVNATAMKNKLKTYIIPLAEKSGTKVVISVNQGSSGAFSSVSASDVLRNKLATNILNFIIENNIHGIDIDWETPASNESTNFTLLMKAIYEKVKSYNNNYLVTAAIGGGKWQPPKYDLPNSKDYLDYVNLMTYSMATGNGYYQNALFKSSKGATLTSCSIDESIDLYNGYGVTNDKILIGIPFYVTVQSGCEGPGSKVGSGKSIWYKELFSTYKLSDTMKEYFDEECGVPYRYDAVNKIFISFDNEQSIKRKCEYIHAKGLAGIMYWQYGQDVDDTLSNAIAKYIDK